MAAGSRPRPIDLGRLPRLRAAAQLLHRPASARDPAEIARAIAGAQAQDRYAGPLTFRSRSRRLTLRDIDRARTQERSLLRTWLMRMTIHLVPTEDAGWLLPLFEPGIEAWSRRRLGQLGMPARTQAKALRVVQRALEAEGPLTRSEIGERLAGAGIELDAQTRLHVNLTAVTSGIACLGPDRGASSCMVLRRDWLGPLPRFDRDAALAELARRYLRAFGPASERDFAGWSGLALRDVRAGLGAIAGELVESRLGEQALFSLRAERRRLPGGGHVRLLGAFDTYILGYRDRQFALPAEGIGALKEGGGGWIRPVIVADGRIIGTWRAARTGGRLEVALHPFGSLSGAASRAIEAEVEDLGRFEGKPVAMVGEMPALQGSA